MFKNKVVLVTGGSAGIGAAAAELFAKEGASVAIVGRNEANLKEVVARCKKHGSKAFAIKADVSKDEDVDSIVKQTVDKFGKLDVLVNNAGIIKAASIESDHFLDTFDEIMNVNMRGPARITRHAVPHIIKSKGNIVNVSSVAATCTSRPNYIAYRTSKAALNHFTRCCALELGQYGVRVNSVSPGPTQTNIFRDTSTDSIDALKDHTLLKRVSESEEVADLIIYVASEKAKSVTGSDFVIDNGGNAGIGAAIAEGFAKKGASPAIVGRNEAKLKDVAQRCKNLGASILIIKADVSIDREAKDIVKKTIDRYGRLDVLVNNAGVLKAVTISESNILQTYDEVMTTNLRSVIHITSLAIPYLQETKGNIINMSSAAANTELPGLSAYCISKAGMDKFTRCAALEFASSGVRVNSVNPGPVESDMLKTLLTLDCLTDKSSSDITALGRASEVHEVADLVLYLASDKTRSITGSCYAIDNGILLK